MSTLGQIQPLKIPDAVVALAQAAAKANSDTEKYLPGWPLFSPPKMQLTKCAKCPREFCSSIAFRRHSRVHRRALKIDKDFPKNRDHVAAFWDKEEKAVKSLIGPPRKRKRSLWSVSVHCIEGIPDAQDGSFIVRDGKNQFPDIKRCSRPKKLRSLKLGKTNTS